VTALLGPRRVVDPLDGLVTSVAVRASLAAASRIRAGSLTVRLPDGTQRVFGDPASDLRGEMHLHDLGALRRVLLRGEVGAGEAYMEGLWSSPDLVALLSLAVANRTALGVSRGWWRVPARLMGTFHHHRNRNTRAGSRRNIIAHYDLGNDFYRLWLDETMTYSSALFESPDQSLADAQRAKYRRMAELAGLERGQHVLEIGTGWGGFALYAAGTLGCRVTSVTISPAQHTLARERVAEAGLGHLVDVQLRDYRDIAGTYDAIVSIEMLEAVGAEHYEDFFDACAHVLRPGGRMAVQVITFPHDAYLAQLRGANWIQRYIFPGGVLPSLAAIETALEGTPLLVTGVADIRDSYATTLRTWRARFFAHLPEVRGLGFDDRFVRMWDYYLSISEAGFRMGVIQDLQLSLQKGRGIAAPGDR
jgi:cyclopropane-fatty-acyl-phospholipid synthase